MEPKRRKRGNRKRRYHPYSWMLSPLYFIGLFAYIELVFHIREFRNVSAVFPMLFAIPAGLLTGFFCDLFSEKYAKWLRWGISIGFMVLFSVQMVYFHIFQSFIIDPFFAVTACAADPAVYADGFNDPTGNGIMASLAFHPQYVFTAALGAFVGMFHDVSPSLDVYLFK